MTRWFGVAALMALVAFGSAACGGGTPQTPSQPTNTGAAGPGVSSVTQGATIMGNVSAGTPLGAMAAQVAGTSISSPVGSGGDFSLAGVPEGSVQLRFVGSGVDASVALDPVKPGDVVSILVGVSGATATIQSESRNSGGKVELEGLIQEVTLPTFKVDGRTVATDSSTTVRDCAGLATLPTALTLNQRVHVRGTLSAGTVTAEIVTIQCPDATETPGTPQDDSASVEGVLKSLSGTPPTLTLVIGTTTVTTTASTVVQRRGDVQTLADLKLGQTVHAVGVRQSNGSIIARMLQIKDDATGGLFVIEGSLGGLKGTCPTITFVVNGYSVATSGATTFAPACKDLKSGAKVEVAGNRQADGSVAATTVTKK